MHAHNILLHSTNVFAARALPVLPSSPGEAWRLDALLGRFVEIGGGPDTAALSLCAGLVCAAQQQGGLAAWIGATGNTFFPPDFAEAGIDLAALPVIRVEDEARAWRVCDTLLRSGGFSLVVLDMNRALSLPFSAQTRLAGLTKRHNAALVLLTRELRRETPRGSLVSLRVATGKHRTGHDCFACEIHGVKDKRQTPGWKQVEWFRGTDGLC